MIVQPSPQHNNEAKHGSAYHDMACLAISDPGLLHATMLAACRHLSRQQSDGHSSSPGCRQQPGRDHYLALAMYYKVKCVETVIAAIAARHATANNDSSTDAAQLRPDHATLAKIMVLALDELWLGELAMAQYHVRGAVKLLELDGGLQTLRRGGFVASMVSNFLSNPVFAEKDVQDSSQWSHERPHSIVVENHSARDECMNPCETMSLRFFTSRLSTDT
ncbi:hypothetical protein Micbo1qcDRAFT_23155 [Microdochium bolleyi]|uniref:Uncharacterized protein n=1 Tax=Microdochium bolleyi TaxID=196109 RepID=A0A136IQY9_9PEZI|nr:hypothetical protein Micbo1qcDRAFT_23155 [Microdochium bolleyi]